MIRKMSRTSHGIISDGDIFYARWDAVEKYNKLYEHINRGGAKRWEDIRKSNGDFVEFIFEWDDVDDENYMGMQIYFLQLIDDEICKTTAICGFAEESSRFERFFTRIKPMPEWEMKRPNTIKAKRGW
jgi:hypothetical protein